jgi:hypothetical protein
MRRLIALAMLVVFLAPLSVFAKEGMWLPILLKKYNIEEMQKMGFKLTAEDIYDINKASMKDAVVIFGGGCTGELISDKGLLITNHHCGYRQIQAHSSLENDYLTNGFWAMSQKEELPNPGLSVKFLVRMADVTAEAMEGITDDSKEQKELKKNIKEIEKAAEKDNGYKAIVKPIFNGNQYFLFVYEEYKDVRLVGAPPSAIGKFGGDTDNWMWPRHTGDFSLFRIYADKDGKPAEYSPNNVPLKPKKFFPISMKGVKTNDFTMVFGYPGSTARYLPSQAVDRIMNVSDPDKVAIRTLKLKLMNEDMEADRGVRIQYAAKNASTSNAWKKWQGEIKGLKRLNAVERKLNQEKAFKAWMEQDPARQKTYGEVLPQFEELYKALKPYSKAYDYYSEIIYRGTDIFSIARTVDRLIKRSFNYDAAKRQKAADALKASIDKHFKDYNQPTDEKIFTELLKVYGKEVDCIFQPEFFCKNYAKLESGKFTKKIYRKSILTSKTKLNALLNDFTPANAKKLEKDPIIRLYREFVDAFTVKVWPNHAKISTKIGAVQKLYMKALMEMNKAKALYPDANFTLRVAYGKVEGYQPKDGVTYKHFTTLDGIIAKDNPEIYDYNVPQRLKELYKSKDYGQYADPSDGKVHTCFVASNHTTGGNSGSPVVNAEGHLIGVNFDRCWEGTMSDIMFDPERCRNIVLDIRYALFLIDKFAGAGYLLDEMQLVK